MKYKGGIEKRGNVGGDWFILIKSNKAKKTLEDFSFKFENYWIIKATSYFQFCAKKEVEEMKYATFIFKKKNKYKKKEIEDWISFFKKNKINLKFIGKPFPSNSLIKKIKIINEI